MIFYFSVDEHLGPLYFLTIMNNIAINIYVQGIFLHGCMLSFLLNIYSLRSRTARSYGNSMFSPLRKCQVVFKVVILLYIPTSNI